MNNLQTLLDFTFQSFWHFLGVFIIITAPFNFITRMSKIISNHRLTKKHGWNPDTNKEKKDS